MPEEKKITAPLPRSCWEATWDLGGRSGDVDPGSALTTLLTPADRGREPLTPRDRSIDLEDIHPLDSSTPRPALPLPLIVVTSQAESDALCTVKR